MQKYKFLYETKEGSIEILLLGKEEKYECPIEISFIDSFTTTFANESECIKYLYEKKIIPNQEGRLCIKKPKGKVSATPILFNNSEFRQIAKQANSSLKQTGRLGQLKETQEFVKYQSRIIKFFYENDKAAASFQKSFFASSALVSNLSNYLTFKYHSPIYEPSEITRREEFKSSVKSILKNYDTLREVCNWITQYEKPISYSWKNPMEEYERKKDELEERKTNL